MIRLRTSMFTFPIDLEPGGIISLVVESKKLYRDLSTVLDTLDESSVFLFQDGAERQAKKHVVVTRDLLNLDPNSKKILTAIYKKIDRTALTPERREKFDRINQAIAELLEDFASDFEGQVSFNDQISLTQLLGHFDFKFDYDESSFLTSFVSYFRAWREAMDLKLLITYDLFAYLEEEEISILSQELGYTGVALVDIDHSDGKRPGVKRFLIDRDLCEIY